MLTVVPPPKVTPGYESLENAVGDNHPTITAWKHDNITFMAGGWGAES